MNGLTYAPASGGGWVAVASGSQLVVVHSDASDRVPQLWDAVNGPDAFSAVIRTLARDGFSALPEFALVDTGGERLRVIVRGAVSLEIDDVDGSHSQNGADVSTWTERTFTGATAVRVSITDAASATPTELPMTNGAAWVSSCTLTLDPAARSTPPPAVETADPAAALVEETLLAGAVDEEADASAASETTFSAFRHSDGDDLDGDETEGADADDADGAAADGDEADAGGADSDDALTGDTVFVPRRRRASAVAPATPAAVPVDDPQPEPVPDGDHDGMTILSSDLPRGRTRATAPVATDSHPPPLVLVGADETRHPLDQPLIVGRAPSATQVSGGRLPRLVTVGGSDPDISRTHARFALEGDSVVVTDLHSRNGTLVVLPGRSPQKLRAGEPTTVIAGTVIDLGGGITFRVDG